MISIDKAIEFYKGYKDRSGGTVNYNEFDEQMVEWLEELSRRRVEELFRKANEKAIRDKAIDDFVIAIICELKNRYTDMPIVDILGNREKWKEKKFKYLEFENLVYKIEKQLKAGGNDEMEK